MSPEGRQVKRMGRQSRERGADILRHEMMLVVQNALLGCPSSGVFNITNSDLVLPYYQSTINCHCLSNNSYFAELTMHENLGLNVLC